ncbi:MAG: hypothetical protein L6R40_001120 [Gallowayella cf. fulva]|nr:MAG: hypothetical protein L6R40_001120 [Xanthomendoza cf. fulva]
MAPSSGHLLVPKALRIFKFAVAQAGALVRSKLPQTSTGVTAASEAVLQPIRLYQHVQPTHPAALLRQSRSSAHRKFTSQAKAHHQTFDRPSFRKSRIGQAVTRSFGSPFASTLRPNLTGGALPRTAGGYGLGGAQRVRHFSHTGAVQAQVIQNVSAGLRAFCIRGGKARFDGVDQTTGVKRFKSVSEAEDRALRQIQASSSSAWIKGTNLEFRLNPTITSFPTLTGKNLQGQTLGTVGFLDTLGADFARALKDLSSILTDLKRLAAFGDLPIDLTKSKHGGSTLSVRFAGCDADTVSRLCDEVGVHRGVIREDEAWNDDKDVKMALLFPFAPSNPVSDSDHESALFDKTLHADSYIAPEQLEWRNMLSPSEPAGQRSDEDSAGFDHIHTPLSTDTPHYSYDRYTPPSPAGYESLGESDFAMEDPYYHQDSRARTRGSGDLQGLESLYRFLAECDEARR